MDGEPGPSTQQHNHTSNAVIDSNLLLLSNESDPPEDTIVLNRTFQIPKDPIFKIEKDTSLSAAQSEYLPSHDSDSDREKPIDTKLWQKASQDLRERRMPTNKRPVLKDLRFLDGDVELQQFPQHLLQSLEKNCRAIRSNIPTCARTLGTSKITLVDGREAYFMVESTGEKLLQARFKYGANQQIIIVKERVGKAIDRGRAVVVTGILGGPQPFTDPSGVRFNESRFKIWSHTILTRHSPAIETDIVRLIRAPDPQPSTPKTPEHPFKVTTTSTDRAQGSPKPANSIEASSPFRSVILPATTPAVVANGVEMAEDIDSSDSDAPLINSTARRHASQSSIIDNSRETTQASPSMRKDLGQHSRQAKQNITIPYSSPTTDSARSPEFHTPSRRLESATPFTSMSVSSISRTRPDREEHCPTFMFKKTENGPASRSKSAAICNTVEKLFAQARVAGIIEKDWSMLRLSVAAGDVSKEVTIIRGDREDFEGFLEQAKQLGDVEISVLPGDE